MITTAIIGIYGVVVVLDAIVGLWVSRPRRASELDATTLVRLGICPLCSYYRHGRREGYLNPGTPTRAHEGCIELSRAREELARARENDRT